MNFKERYAMKMLMMASLGAAAAVAMAQVGGPPPMKMGLWETKTQTKISGIELPPGVDVPGLGNRTIVVRSCYTPDTWQKGASQSREMKDCTRTNESMSAGKYSFDVSCKNKMSGHFEMVFDSKESSHSTMSVQMDAGGGEKIHTDSLSTSTFIGADCGTVTSEKPQIVSR